MTARLITVDLNAPDAAALEALDAELRRRLEIRTADPELRAHLLRLLPLIPSEAAQVITEAMDEVHPAIVLSEWWDAFYKAFCAEPLPAPRAYPQPVSCKVDPDPWNKWLREDATHVGLVAREMVRFGASPDTAIDGALAITYRLDLDPETAERAILAALMEKSI